MIERREVEKEEFDQFMATAPDLPWHTVWIAEPPIKEYYVLKSGAVTPVAQYVLVDYTKPPTHEDYLFSRSAETFAQLCQRLKG